MGAAVVDSERPLTMGDAVRRVLAELGRFHNELDWHDEPPPAAEYVTRCRDVAQRGKDLLLRAWCDEPRLQFAPAMFKAVLDDYARRATSKPVPWLQRGLEAAAEVVLECEQRSGASPAPRP